MSPAALLAGSGARGAAPGTIVGVARDSRRVAPGMLYIAQGAAAERSAHIHDARARGAIAVAADSTADHGAEISVAHARAAFAAATLRAAGGVRAPLVGVTGTKGKTTTAWCAWWALGGPAAGAARVGTVGWHDGVRERPNPQTTPPPEELAAFLAALPASCPGVALEVSSHGADQQRLAGAAFTAFACTGIGHDHLDYHRTVAHYVGAKLRALRLIAPGAPVIINADDARAALFAHAARTAGARVWMLGFGPQATAFRLLPCDTGHVLDSAAGALPLPRFLPGAFNAWNAAAGALLAHAAGCPLAHAVERLATCPPPPGRLERLAEAPATYVDYAHTPESLTAAITALRQAHPGAPLAVVFGCGGDRDASKRAPMGRAAATADHIVITTDNARSEDPAAIAAQIARGCPNAAIEPDRAAAIVLGRSRAGRDGVLLVAGKGHEDYQIIGTRTVAWDDRAFVQSGFRVPGCGIREAEPTTTADGDSRNPQPETRNPTP